MSQTSQPKNITSVDQLDLIVEADGHLTDTPEVILPYMDKEFDDVREFYERSPAGGLELNPTSIASSAYLYENLKEREGKEGFSFFDHHGPDELREAMDEHGIDVAIANNIGSSPLRNPRHAAGIVNGYNRWMIDVLDDYPDIYGTLLATPLDPEYTAEEIHRHGDENSVVGVQFLGTSFMPLPSDRKYDSVWAAASEHDLPVTVHSGTGPRAFPQQFHWSETYAEDHIDAHPMQQVSVLTSFLLGGVLEAYPDLELVFQEAGIGYVAPLKNRLDHTFQRLGYEVPGISKRPSEYIDERVFFCTQPLGHTAKDPKHLAWLIEMAGVDNVMWSSDIPHPDFDTPEELFDRIKVHFDDELSRLMGGTAKQVFGI